VAVQRDLFSVVGVPVGRTVVNRPVVDGAHVYDTVVRSAPGDPALVDVTVVDVVLYHVTVVECTVLH